MAGAFALSAGSAGSSAPADPAEQLRLDQIQVVGTHNSYALPIDRRVVALAGPKLRAMKEAMAGKLSPAQQAALRDEHPGPLDDPIQPSAISSNRSKRSCKAACAVSSWTCSPTPRAVFMPIRRRIAR